MKPETSIIIRTKNEQKWLGKVLERLFEQTYQDFELVIIDSGSKDKTLEIAKKYPVKILEIPPQDFSYPYALNYAISKSQSTKYIVLLSAHSVPMTKEWLKHGIEDFGLDPKIVGVYGIWKALPGSTIWDKFNINVLFHIASPWRRRKIFRRFNPGLLQFTNAIIKREFWEKEPFDERRGHGGEDTAWALFWIKKGYKIMLDRKFNVMHSHELDFKGWQKQYRYWASLVKPKPFEPLSFRKTHF